MAANNMQIAAIFDEIADLLDIQGENPFRIRAYRNAGRLLRGLKDEAASLIEAGKDLSELPGIGADLAGKIREVVETGSVEILRRLRRELPAGLVELLRIPGLGPKRAKLLHDELGITGLADLQRAAASGRLRQLKALGPKTVERLRAGLKREQETGKRLTLLEAAPYVRDLLRHMRAVRGIGKVDVAGSYRRGRETIGDIDLVATAENAPKAIEAFAAYPEVAQVTAQGSTRATVLLRGGVQADLRVVAAESYGAALYYFTGSKAHNIAVRQRAQRRGLKINEYGVFKGARRIAGETEESVFAAVGLPFIPPELREDRGEIDAAEKGSLPVLVRRSNLRGDLHAHTTASDGQDSLNDMATAGRAKGLEYLAITEHTRRLTVTHGLDSRRLGRLCDAIDRLNEEPCGCTLLKGIEVDILEDGRLDLPDTALGQLDLVVGAVHSHFELPAAKQTARLLRAMDHKHFSILAHPTGRLLRQREMSRFDIDRVIGAAKDRGCFLEINSQPDRLDLADIYCRTAKAAGVLLSIGSDAHSTAQLDFLEFGVLQARRGWLEKADILNSRSLQRLRPLLARTM